MKTKNKIILFGKRLIYDKKKKVCIYYMDLEKKWKFYTNEKGFLLLLNCFYYVKKILKKYKKKYDINIKNGKEIYSKKSNLKKTGITWTEEEYNNDSMRYIYIIVKSFQRFTEMWSLLESFDSYYTRKENNVLSLGSGPGFESLAYKIFYKNDEKIKMYGIDSIKKWKSAFENFGSFYDIDVLKEEKKFFEFLKKTKINIIILSNVYANYMTNEKGTLFIRKLFFLYNIKFVLINDRSKDLSKFISKFKKYGIYTYFLINKKDHRQIFLTLLSNLNSNGTKKKTFANVPYLK